jgi:hypothetical protein
MMSSECCVDDFEFPCARARLPGPLSCLLSLPFRGLLGGHSVVHVGPHLSICTVRHTSVCCCCCGAASPHLQGPICLASHRIRLPAHLRSGALCLGTACACTLSMTLNCGNQVRIQMVFNGGVTTGKLCSKCFNNLDQSRPVPASGCRPRNNLGFWHNSVRRPRKDQM